MFIFKWFSSACLPFHTAQLPAHPAVTVLSHTFPAEAQAIILMALSLLTQTAFAAAAQPPWLQSAPADTRSPFVASHSWELPEFQGTEWQRQVSV